MTPELKTALKTTISIGTYSVYHETSVGDEKKEIVFTLLPKNQFNHPEFDKLLSEYSSLNPLDDLSQQSKDYLATMDKYYALRLAVINKDSLFEASELEFIEKNLKNYLSKKLTNEAIDSFEEFEHLFDKYSYRAGAIVVGMVGMGAQALEKLVAQDPNEILDKGVKKINSAFDFLRNNLKTSIDKAKKDNKPKP